jgi:protein-disulfide isomerase
MNHIVTQRRKEDSTMAKFVIRIVLSVWIVFGILCVQGFAGGTAEILTSFGTGPVKVRLYTEYFCNPCMNMEPQLEPIIRKLVGTNKINLTFIDVPLFEYSRFYGQSFLYATKGMNELEHTLRVRALLFDAARKNIPDPAALERYLQQKAVNLQVVDTGPIFAARDVYLRSDNIRSTPSCVIERGDKKELYKGDKDIMNALKRLE